MSTSAKDGFDAAGAFLTYVSESLKMGVRFEDIIKAIGDLRVAVKDETFTKR